MDELSEEDVGALRAALIEVERELEQALEGSREGAKVVSLDEPIGRLSRVDAMQQQMAAASERTQALRLGQVRAALGRITEGEYGLCRSCEEPIAIERLRARPESLLCVGCQGARERA